MKFLLVAPTDQDALGLIAGHCKNALLNAGHQVKVFDFRHSQYVKGQILSYLKPKIKRLINFSPKAIPAINTMENSKMNAVLFNEVTDFNPDVVLVLKGETVAADTLLKIRARGAITANWFMDSVYAPHAKPLAEQISPSYDFFFIIDSPDVLEHVKIGAKHVHWLPLASDPLLHRTVCLTDDEKRKYESNITFVGTVIPVREKVLEALVDLGLNVWGPASNIYGTWMDKKSKLFKSYKGGPVFGEEVIKIYNASKIVFSLDSLWGDRIFAVTPRVFEVAGCGAFHLCNCNRQMQRLLEVGSEIVCYKDVEDLRQLCMYFLEHADERAVIACNGQKKVYKNHTYAHRIAEMISFIKSKQ